MKLFKALFPIITAIGVFVLASNSQMYKQMNQKDSIHKETNFISIDVAKPKQ